MNYQFTKELIQDLENIFSVKISFTSQNKITRQVSPYLGQLIADNTNLQTLYTFSNVRFLFAFFYIKLDDTTSVVLVGPTSIPKPIHFSQLSEIPTLYKENFFHDVTNIYKLITHKTPTVHSLETLDSISLSNEIQLDVEKHTEYYTLEKRFLRAVKSNNKSEVEWIFKKFKNEKSASLSVNRLQSIKFKAIALITLLTRVSITEGVPISTAFDLSDTIIRVIDSALSIESCLHLLNQSVLIYTTLIRESSIKIQSKLINEIVLYVDQHIFEPLTLLQISQSLKKSESYISRKFKQETGLSLHKFIIERKLKQAEIMLELSDISLLEISEKLHFSNQSHFSYLFKKMRGYAPSRLRNINNHLNT